MTSIFTRVWLTVHAEHAAAKKAYANLGFRVEGILREAFVLGDRRLDALYMGVPPCGRVFKSRNAGDRAERMKCAILQPSYIPWRGYFHQIQKADVFVFYDDVQYDKHGWRNRNRIKTAGGTQWLTIPVQKKGNVAEAREIREIEISWDRPWNRKHLSTLVQSYAKAPCFDKYAPDVLAVVFIFALRVGPIHNEFDRATREPSWNPAHEILAILGTGYSGTQNREAD